MATVKNLITEDMKKLVIARIQTLPPNLGIAMGSGEKFNKADLIKHVENEDEVGKKYIEMQMEFLRSLKDGSLFR